MSAPAIHLICSTHFLTIHVDADAWRNIVRWEPSLGILIVEGPRRHDDEKDEDGATEANV